MSRAFTENEQEQFDALVMRIGDCSAGNLNGYQEVVRELEEWILDLLERAK